MVTPVTEASGPQHGDVADVFVKGKYANSAYIKFVNSDKMWVFLKFYKGKKLPRDAGAPSKFKAGRADGYISQNIR